MKKKIIKNINPIILTSIIACIGLALTLFCFRGSIQNMITQQLQNRPQIVKDLDASAAQREEKFAKGYTARQTPLPLAQFTAHVDRLEEDITLLGEALRKTAPTNLEEQERLKTFIKARDEESRAFIASNGALLDKYAEKARRQKDPSTLKLINVLKSRTFLFERRV